MATNNIQENLKKYFYSGVGLAAHTAEVVQKSVNELVKNGKVSEADGKKIVGDAIKKVEARRPEIEAKYNEEVLRFRNFKKELKALRNNLQLKKANRLQLRLRLKKAQLEKDSCVILSRLSNLR